MDSEFGRTTDPVRMYMREMGSVELLTREGEIEIAKRIEDGLRHMIQAISACPTTVRKILDLAEKVEKDEIAHRRGRRRADRPERKEDSRRSRPRRPRRTRTSRGGRGGRRGRRGRASTAENLLRLKGEALEKFARIRSLFEKHARRRCRTRAASDKDYLELRDQISAELMTIRFTARTVERLCDSVRSLVEEIRSHERKIQDILVNKANMPRPALHQGYAGAERLQALADRRDSTRGHAWSEPLVAPRAGGARAAAATIQNVQHARSASRSRT